MHVLLVDDDREVAGYVRRELEEDRLIDTVWSDREVTPNNLDVFMIFLRSKVDAPGSPKLIHTERRIGYSLREGTS